MLLCTGSQGEQRAALARIAEEEHPEISFDKGDLVIFSSRTIPGNEKAVGRIQNNLARAGCDILTDNEALVHVSGHPRREELRRMYSLLRPKVVVPMHGEARHLKAQAQLAREQGAETIFTVQDGEIVRLAPDPAVIDDAPVARLFRDGRLLVPEADGPVRARRKLAAVGIVIVSLCLSRRGELMAEPLAELDGVPAETGGRRGYARRRARRGRRHLAQPPGPGAQVARPRLRGRSPRGAVGGRAGVGQEAHLQGAGERGR